MGDTASRPMSLFCFPPDNHRFLLLALALVALGRRLVLGTALVRTLILLLLGVAFGRRFRLVANDVRHDGCLDLVTDAERNALLMRWRLAEKQNYERTSSQVLCSLTGTLVFLSMRLLKTS